MLHLSNLCGKPCPACNSTHTHASMHTHTQTPTHSLKHILIILIQLTMPQIYSLSHMSSYLACFSAHSLCQVGQQSCFTKIVYIQYQPVLMVSSAAMHAKKWLSYQTIARGPLLSQWIVCTDSNISFINDRMAPSAAWIKFTREWETKTERACAD